ncbi:MAG TPA: hypothetical protein VGQ38_09185 [Gaiellaceae bacterium]|nr:hypothetical protein [Gaiellaceae bacterium]
MRGDAQVPKGVRLGERVAGLRREVVRAFQRRNRGAVVASDDLVEATDPEQRLAFAAQIAEISILLCSSLEQCQLACILDPAFEKPCVRDSTARQGDVSLYRIKSLRCARQPAGISAEDSAFIEQPGSLEPLVHG